jgi:16S rRNA (guanine527-N7)-methyltransferase
VTGADPRLEQWLDAVLTGPGLTAARDRVEAARVLVDDALVAAALVEHGPVVDVGSGAGSPGIPIAVSRPDLHVDLLEAQRRRCDFLRSVVAELPNAGVVCARAEEHGRGDGREAYGTAVAQALAEPPVAVEWCLPLVRRGGLLILLVGEVDADRVAVAAQEVGGGPPELVPLPASGSRRRLLLVPKTGTTPDRFPRRPGVARKRPLG